MFCLAALQHRPVLYHSRWLLIVLWPWPSVHLGQLAPTSLPQCRLVSNPCSAGLSLSLALRSVLLFLPLSLSLRDPPSLSLSRIKGVSGCSVGLYPPRGSNPPLRNKRGVLYPLYYEGMLSSLCCTAAQTGCALSLCVSLSLSVCLALSLPPRPSFAPSPHPP